ncbi:MAG: glycosyltransferase family 2 protein [Bacteroidetes bacterium]|nr:glycosyltransferase family 2 protein [Bacteroidota bacterium]MBU1423880.1 glycosyltransferase family 2 protein [Bacteroidota bacterium]
MTEQEPFYSVLVVNYNGRHHLEGCLGSLMNQTYQNFEMVLVDNASTDGSKEFMRERYPWVHLVEAEKNLGFTGGNNLGLRFTKGEWVIFLSNDVLLEPNWLEKMACFLNSDSQLGACGCKMINFYNPSVIDIIGLRIDKFGFPHLIGHSEKDEGQYDLFKDELFISGCCFLIKREVLEKLDEAFDPDYFALGEDLDLSWRIKLLGYRLKINTVTKAYHKSGSTFKALGKKLNTRYLSERNTIRSLLKNYSTSSLLKVMIPYFILWSAEVLFFFFTLRPKMATGVIKAMGWNLLHLKETLAKRKRIQQTRVVGDDSLRDFFVSGSEKIRILKGLESKLKMLFPPRLK